MRPRAILLDMDGVLVDSMPLHAAAWRRVLGEHGLVLDDIDIFRREGMSGRQSVEDIFIEYGVPFPGDAAYAALEERKHALFEQGTVSLFPLVHELLAWARDRAIGTALVTGSPRRSVEHVVPASVLAGFDAVITAGDVTRGKPDPEPYLKAIDALGVVAGEALAVENSPMGIRSARAAGAVCYALETTLPAGMLGGADRIFPGHAELLSFLQSEMG